jgi:hypothetical protein
MRFSILLCSYAFTAASLVGPVLAAFKRATNATLPSTWKPGVKWQIVLHAPVDASKPIVPSEARVWDIDYFHALKYPEIIPKLVRVHDPPSP